MFFHYFHNLSSTHATGRTIHPLPEYENWPLEWKTTYYKSYGNIPSIPLPQNSPKNADFFALVSKRKSVRGGHSEGVSIEDLSVMLKFSCGLQGGVRPKEQGKFRAQPSGGARFPLEIYVCSLKKENILDPGVYHYNVKDNALDVLRKRNFSQNEIANLCTYSWANDCSMMFVITGVFHRGAMKYGERAYRYAMIEAGHIGQGVYLAGEARGVGVVGMGGTNDEAMNELLDIDGTQESLVYALMLSK